VVAVVAVPTAAVVVLVVRVETAAHLAAQEVAAARAQVLLVPVAQARLVKLGLSAGRKLQSAIIDVKCI
jgi:hypothetical protein